MKIIDCFTFYNELDLLFYRLSILNDVVDKFILVEATKTFSGKAKPLYYENNKLMFSQFQHKIIHIVNETLTPYEIMTNKIPNSSDDYWKNEFNQRNTINKGLELINQELNDDDYIIINDLDEIPDPYTLIKIKNMEKNIDIGIFKQKMHYYNLTTIYKNIWKNAKILTYKCYKNYFSSSPQIVRSKNENTIEKMDNFEYIENGGWHLSYFGNEKYIRNKIESFAHQELNNDYFKNENRIKNRIKNKCDLFDRDYAILYYVPLSENQYLPPKYEIYLTQFYD